MCTNPNGCDCSATACCEGCYWNKTIANDSYTTTYNINIKS